MEPQNLDLFYATIEIENLKAQRDDLLAACEAVRELLTNDDVAHITIDKLSDMLPEIESAIARARGE